MPRIYKYQGHPFALWLRKLMIRHKLRAEDVASFSGLNIGTINDWRRGGSMPRVVGFWALCCGLSLLTNRDHKAIALEALPLFDGDLPAQTWKMSIENP